jgi:hypothetical protein
MFNMSLTHLILVFLSSKLDFRDMMSLEEKLQHVYSCPEEFLQEIQKAVMEVDELRKAG